MGITKIEWATHSVNPIRGLCPNNECPVFDNCYARRHYQRFHRFKNGTFNPKWDYTIRWDSEAWPPAHIPKGARVFVCSTIEAFGRWIPSSWLWAIFNYCKLRNDVTWIFLTKRPERLKEFSPFPPNVWVGASAPNLETYYRAMDGLKSVKAAVKFISFEPLIGDIGLPGDLFLKGISWVIVGQMTPVRKSTAKVEWIKEIVTAADKAGVPVFLKDNLAGMFTVANLNQEPRLLNAWDMVCGEPVLRQEFPKLPARSTIEEVK